MYRRKDLLCGSHDNYKITNLLVCFEEDFDEGFAEDEEWDLR